MLVAVFCAVVATFVLDLRGPRTGPARSWWPLCAALVAAALPIGAIVPEATLAHVASVPSFDITRPCVAPPESNKLHAIAPAVMLWLLLPAGVVIGLLRDRSAPRPRFLLGFSFALAAAVLSVTLVRTVRGGVDVGSLRACGALTPEEGTDASRVRAVVQGMVGDARLQILRWRDLPHLPAPPWVRGEIPVTIDGHPWSLRVHRASVVAEPDDPRRADRPLPALHFASIPSMAVSAHSTVLLDHRPDGKLYAVRVGQPVRVDEIGKLLRPPRWPLLVMIVSLVSAVALLVGSRQRRALVEVFAPYRVVSVERVGSALPAVCALILIEASATTLHVLAPYL
jgi:hypothetical protein